MRTLLLLLGIYSVAAAQPAAPAASNAPASPPSGERETVRDIDGNVYHTVRIGDQVWLRENLRTTRYRNGDRIPTTNPATRDIANEAEPKYQWSFGGSERNAEVYGRLYTFHAVADPRGICPEGWRVPTNADWMKLLNFLGRHEVAGGKLKETGTAHWAAPNTGATNESGFTALPGAGRLPDGAFRNLGRFGAWWTASGSYWYIECDAPNALRTYIYQSGAFGFSVRCIKN